MQIPKIYEGEYRFCQILWENEPTTCAELARLCSEKLGWGRTTTYTVIKRLSERGIVHKEDSVVTSCFSKQEVQETELTELMERTFEGSLPAFVNAFGKKQNISEKEIAGILALLGYEEDGK